MEDAATLKGATSLVREVRFQEKEGKKRPRGERMPPGMGAEWWRCRSATHFRVVNNLKRWSNII